MKKIKLPEVLEALLKKHKLNPNSLSKLISVSQPTITRLMSSDTQDPRIQSLIPIAKFFNVSIDQLVGLAPLDVDATEPNLTSCPVYDWSNVKRTGEPIGWVAAPRELAHCFAVKCIEDIPEHGIKTGDHLLIDPESDVHSRDLVLAVIGGGAALRMVLVDGGNAYLTPLNPSLAALAAPLAANDNNIVGVVMSVIRYLN